MSELQGLLGYNPRTGTLTMERELGLEIGWLADGGPSTIGVQDAFSRIREADRPQLHRALAATQGSEAPVKLAYGVRDRNGRVRSVSFDGLWFRDPAEDGDRVFGRLREIGRPDPDLDDPTPADRVLDLAREILRISRAHGTHALSALAVRVMAEAVERASDFSAPPPAKGAGHGKRASGARP